MDKKILAMDDIELFSTEGQSLFYVIRHENCRTKEVAKATGLSEKAVYMALRRLAFKGIICRADDLSGQIRWAIAKDQPPSVDRGAFRKVIKWG